jgi:hypothetical protein
VVILGPIFLYRYNFFYCQQKFLISYLIPVFTLWESLTLSAIVLYFVYSGEISPKSRLPKARGQSVYCGHQHT